MTSLNHLRVVTQKQVCELVPYTEQHIRRLEKAGKFPRRMKLGQNRVGWRLVDIEAWLTARMPAQLYASDPDLTSPLL